MAENDFFGGDQPLQVGANSISVSGVSFDRTVKIQFSSADIEFDAITINGESGYLPNQIGGSKLFDNTANATWTKVLTLALASDGASSQTVQTAEINITDLPSGGANYRVYKTTANNQANFGSPATITSWRKYDLSLRSSHLTEMLKFNLVVKVQILNFLQYQ